MGGILYRNRNAGKVDKDGKKKKASWQYRFELSSIDGKRVREEKGGFTTKKECEEAAATAYAQYMNAGHIIKIKDMSFADCLDKWFESYVKVNCNETTQENYAKRIKNHIKPILGKYKLTSITTDVIQDFVNTMAANKYSRNSIAVTKGIISKTLKYAKKNRWVQYNECSDVDMPTYNATKYSRRKERTIIPKEVIIKIFSRFPYGHSCYIPLLFGYRLGTRLGESFALTWDDINFDQSTISVDHQVQWDKEKNLWRMQPPKYHSNRIIDADKDTMRILKKLKMHQMKFKEAGGSSYIRYYLDDNSYITETPSNTEIELITIRDDGSYIQPRVMQHCSFVIHNELEYPEFDFHSLRHTHATELAEAGVNIKEIQRRLGHKSYEVTDHIYLHASENMREQSKNIIDNLFDS